MDINWSNEVVEQLDWHWQNQLRPRLEGLTDQEYFWEPVPGCWSLRKRGTSTAPRAAGGRGVPDDDPAPPPRTRPPPLPHTPEEPCHRCLCAFRGRDTRRLGEHA